ncbi:DUF2155 domain-containing protein [Anaplasmataceae bacterium AB001_6]|nr:DUF2155 domain-containing protein [Anaplasmataceae bacterium AB001_6]
MFAKLIYYSAIVISFLTVSCPSCFAEEIFSEDSIMYDLLNQSKDELINNMRDSEDYTFMNKAEFIILNKVSARRNVISLEVNEERVVDNLILKFDGCIYQDDYGDNMYYALVNLYDIDRDFNNEKFFIGWLASYPTFVTKVEHPIYDVVLKRCM